MNIKKKMKVLISSIVFLYDLIIDFFSRIFRLPRAPKLNILYYHSVKDFEVELFNKQICLLIRKTKVLNPDFNLSLNNKKTYSMITFDDAFLSLERNALPILISNKIIPLIFVPTKWIGKNPGWLRGLNHIDSNEMIMTKKKLIELSKFVVFASHCHSHSNLSELPELESGSEILDSKNILEEILGKKIDSISFPHGAYKDQDFEVAIKAGYELIFSIEPEQLTNKNISKNRVLGRVKVDPSDSIFEFYLKISGAYRWMVPFSKWKIKLKKRLNTGVVSCAKE